jgi:hypothetical protein
MIISSRKRDLNLGNTSASNRTVSMPSRAKAEAVNEPPGPPPTTRTVHLEGMEFIIIVAVSLSSQKILAVQVHVQNG